MSAFAVGCCGGRERDRERERVMERETQRERERVMERETEREGERERAKYLILQCLYQKQNTNYDLSLTFFFLKTSESTRKMPIIARHWTGILNTNLTRNRSSDAILYASGHWRPVEQVIMGVVR